MAAKSVIAGEYILQIAENGHVDVVRVFRNAMKTMKDIAASKNFPVEEKWNTQDLGRHLVKEFGDGKTAKFDDVTINKMPDGKIEIYQECKNTMEALRTISAQLGFVLDEKWNTQTSGAKLAAYLMEHKEEADKLLQTPNSKKQEVTSASEDVKIEPAPEVTEKVKHSYRLIIKNPKVAEIALSKFSCDRSEVEEMLEDEEKIAEAEDYGGMGEYFFEDQGMFERTGLLHHVITGCDEVVIIDENDKEIEKFAFNQLLSEDYAEDWTEEIFNDMNMDEDELAFVSVRKAVPCDDIVYTGRSYKDSNLYEPCIFNALGLHGISVQKIGHGIMWDLEGNAPLPIGNDDIGAYIISGSTPEIIWED